MAGGQIEEFQRVNIFEDAGDFRMHLSQRCRDFWRVHYGAFKQPTFNLAP